MKNIELYEQDFNAWIHAQVLLLERRDFNDVDIEHLIEELKDMGKSHLNELGNRLVILIAHLLKWQFQVEKQSSSWRGSIIEQRVQIARLIRKNPSLKTKIHDAIIDAYPDALEIALKETQLAKNTFPNECPFTVEQLLNDAFMP